MTDAKTPGYGDETEATDEDNGKGDGDGKWLGSSTAGGGDAKEQKRYMQAYLQVIMRLYGKSAFSKEQQKLANKAYSMRAAGSTFAEMLRRFDPMYVKTESYKTRVAEATKIYREYRPGRPVPNDFIKNYAHSEMNELRLRQKIESSKWFKREFAGWTEAQKAGSSAGMSPTTFINYRTLWNRALQRAYGRGASKLEQRMMFSAGMTGDEVANNMAELFGGQEALKWATGGTLDRKDIVQGALTTIHGTNTLGQTKGARQTQAGFLAGENKQFGIDVDELTGNLTSSRI